MFNSITGKITEKHVSSFFIETAGVEWDVAASATTLSALPAPGSLARIFTYLYHREDQVRLFGFASSAERSVFLDLMKVEGIGPKQALKILSGLPLPLLLRALDDGDVEGLSRLPGLGKKTAQKIVLALRGKLTLDERGERGKFEDIVNALVEMGFDRKLAVDAVQASSEELDALPAAEAEQEILRRSIVRLSN